ncbi:hypothetical protein [Paraburkholderia sp. BL25I1N1]|uniref:hypothetical protein n=1 Tax=Paraburkholderia sp. BL25I1N1 TaxID=1938804 RepID=UPI000D4B947E|nr:hypothetical protein [Paraburkholderia sp. BL25I1N1]PRY04413.1 hypothetical protein B0G73_11289 [Paraburkholderia sp. BL25I1N1]
MRILTSTGSTPQFVTTKQWDLAFHGGPIDARGTAAVEWVRERASLAHVCDYDIRNSRGLLLNGMRAPARDIATQLVNARSVLLEATTLGLVELLNLLRAAQSHGLAGVDILYLEPNEYRREVVLDAPWTREFSLSTSRRFEGVPGFLADLSLVPERQGRLVAFLGYEGARLAQACEQLDALASWRKYAVFGIPGYAPGWEINAMANNVATLQKEGFESVRFCGAASVSGAYDLLEAIHAEGVTDDATTVVAPLGTKPHGIATALFLIAHSRFQASSLIYDHPARSPNRSTEIRKWHLYRVRFNAP